jgi:hypothetical protein
MATLHLVNSTTGEEYEVPEIDFSIVKPKDILTNTDLGLPPPPAGETWCLLKGSARVDDNTTLQNLGFQDGDKAMIVAKVSGAR